MSTVAAEPSWLAEERLVAVAWSRVAEAGDRVAPLARQVLGAAEALRLVLAGRPLPREVAGDPTGGGDASAGLSRRSLDDAADRWRVRLRGLDPGVDLATVERIGGRVVLPADDEWPVRLDDLGPGTPPCLWVRGRLDLGAAAARSVSVVGSRASTTYGDHVAATIAAGLGPFAVVSGGALGIDAAAHRAALAVDGATVAVLACGVDRVYPSAHANLLRRIAESGVVVSESPPGGAPTRWRFLERNRLIAAVSSATVVVEAAWRSGALSTAMRAAGLGRPLGAVPGPVTSAASAGCHRLLRELSATCVTDAQEVLELASGIGEVQPTTPVVEERPHDDLDGFDLRVWEALPVGSGRAPASVAGVAGLPERQVLGALGRLGLRGLAEAVTTPAGERLWRRARPAAPVRLAPHPTSG